MSEDKRVGAFVCFECNSIETLSGSNDSFMEAALAAHGTSDSIHKGSYLVVPQEMWDDPEFQAQVEQNLKDGRRELAEQSAEEAAQRAQILAMYGEYE